MHLTLEFCSLSFEISGDDWTLYCRPGSHLQGHSLKSNTTPLLTSLSVNPKAPDSRCTQEGRGAGRGCRLASPGKERERLTLQGFSCHHIRKIWSRSNFLHFLRFIKSQSVSLGGKATAEEGPLGIETQTACMSGGGVTHCLTKVSCDIKHGLRPVNTDLCPSQPHPHLSFAPPPPLQI